MPARRWMPPRPQQVRAPSGKPLPEHVHLMRHTTWMCRSSGASLHMYCIEPLTSIGAPTAKASKPVLRSRVSKLKHTRQHVSAARTDIQQHDARLQPGVGHGEAVRRQALQQRGSRGQQRRRRRVLHPGCQALVSLSGRK